MASKRKAGKKASRSPKRAGKKSTAKHQPQKRKNSKTTVKKKPIPKTAAKKKAPASSVRRSTIRRSTRSGVSRRRRNESELADSQAFSQRSSGLQSGDLQGLSDLESVDSESVGELMEEGNAFEAGVVSGVEDSAAREGKEVRTREVPEDDVPGEYLDEE